MIQAVGRAAIGAQPELGLTSCEDGSRKCVLEFVLGFSPRLSFFRSSNASAPKHQSSGSCLFSSIVTKNFCCASASILPADLVPICEFVCRPTILSTEQEYLPTVGDRSSPKTRNLTSQVGPPSYWSSISIAARQCCSWPLARAMGSLSRRSSLIGRLGQAL